MHHHHCYLIYLVLIKKLCIRSYEYLQALALGLQIVDSKWLTEYERTKKWSSKSKFKIWGDLSLFHKLIHTAKQFEKTFSPKHAKKLRKKGVCHVSRSHVKKVRTGRAKPMFSNYFIAVFDDDNDDDGDAQLSGKNKFFTKQGLSRLQHDNKDMVDDDEFNHMINEYVIHHSANTYSHECIGVPSELTSKQVK